MKSYISVYLYANCYFDFFFLILALSLFYLLLTFVYLSLDITYNIVFNLKYLKKCHQLQDLLIYKNEINCTACIKAGEIIIINML